MANGNTSHNPFEGLRPKTMESVLAPLPARDREIVQHIDVLEQKCEILKDKADKVEDRVGHVERRLGPIELLYGKLTSFWSMLLMLGAFMAGVLQAVKFALSLFR